MNDPYGVLGLPRGASTEQVKTRYRELAKLFHPDLSRNPDAQMFRTITRAYQTIMGETSAQGAQRGVVPPHVRGVWRAGAIWQRRHDLTTIRSQDRRLRQLSMESERAQLELERMRRLVTGSSRPPRPALWPGFTSNRNLVRWFLGRRI